jgi:hypothetical protein
MKKRNSDMKFYSYVLLLAFTTIQATSCSKTKGSSSNDDHHPVNENDTTMPVIRIDRPAAGQVFANGDTVKIEGVVTDNSLYQGKIKIINDGNGLLVNEKNYNVHNQQSVNYSLLHKTSVSVITDYTITIEFEDHGLNKAVQTVRVKVTP